MNEHISRQFDRQTELKNCEFVKTTMMILIVFYHSILFWNGTWFTENPVKISECLGKVAEWLNSFHIYTFTMVSGYIFGYLKLEKGKYSAFVPFLKSKARRLCVPYIFLAILWVIPVHCLFFGSDLAELFRKYILVTSPRQLWILIMLSISILPMFLRREFRIIRS